MEEMRLGILIGFVFSMILIGSIFIGLWRGMKQTLSKHKRK